MLLKNVPTVFVYVFVDVSLIKAENTQLRETANVSMLTLTYLLIFIGFKALCRKKVLRNQSTMVNIWFAFHYLLSTRQSLVNL